MAEPYYCTCDDLRTELGVDRTVLPDDQATTIITDAEDIVDALLGAWRVDMTTGRKATNIGALSWQMDKLGRATTKLAARLYREPDLFEKRQWQSMRGPDFAFSGPLTALIGPQIENLLNQCGLRRLTTRATPRVDQRGLGYLSPEQIANGPDAIEGMDESGAYGSYDPDLAL
jgi:hypothetical protein